MQGESKVAILLSHKQICRGLWARRGRARERDESREGEGDMEGGAWEREILRGRRGKV